MDSHVTGSQGEQKEGTHYSEEHNNVVKISIQMISRIGGDLSPY